MLRILAMVGSAPRSDLVAEDTFFLELEDARRVSTPSRQTFVICDALNLSRPKAISQLAVARDQLTLEPTKVIASPSTTPRNSLPLFTTTKCAAITPLKIPDAVQFELTM
jgi:hypothetical protein